MDAKSWNAVRAAYENALGLPTEDLRPPVAELDSEESATLDFMLTIAETAFEDQESADGSSSMRPGQLLGPFLIRSILGQGGMGSVFLAEQMSPIRRTVALKVIRADLSTPHFARRFEAERQALALMEHPGIAKVLEADSGPDGSPYFAMEFVDGVAIDTYCDEQRLTVRQRVELMIQVCDAIEHAHRRGVIHRDLKPTNLLIGEVSDKPQAKVIDFGIAKALSPEVGSADLTGIDRVVGTPFYMSPEQIEGQPLDVRSDVWALSMVLYQLVTGSLPYPDDLRKEASPVRRLIRMREAGIPRPSTRFTRNSEERRRSLAESRGTTAREMERRLKNDLDWILLKGLEEDREQRYGSATELKEDLQRYLEGAAVKARPADRLYLVRKFVSRHRLAVIATAVTLAALVLGTVAATVGLIRARHAEQRAAAEASTALAINEFLSEMLSSADPHEGSRDIQVSAILESAAAGLEDRFPDRPDIRIELLKTIGSSFHHLGRSDKGTELLERAYDEAKALGNDPRALDAAIKLGEAYGDAGRIEEAISVTEPILSSTEGEHRDMLLLRATALNNLAVFRFHQGLGQEGIPLMEESVRLRTEFLGPGNEKTLGALSNLAGLRAALGESERSLADLQELAQRKRIALGPAHPSTLATLELLGNTYGQLDRFKEGEGPLRENYESCQSVFGLLHRRVGIAANALAQNLRNQHRFREALPIQREARETILATVGRDSDFAIAAFENEALILIALGENENAVEPAREALTTLEVVFPEDLSWRSGLTNTLADALVTGERRAEGLALYETAFELDLEVAEDALSRGRSWLNLSEKLIAARAASPRAVEAAQLAQSELTAPDVERWFRRARVAEANALSLLGRDDESLQIFSELLGSSDSPNGTNARELVAYANALTRAGRDSRPSLEAALELADAPEGGDAWKIHRDLARLPGAAGLHLKLARSGCAESLGTENPACRSLDGPT